MSKGATSLQTALRILSVWGPPIPLVCLLSTLPYAVIYLLNLWELPHYQFFPLPLLAVGWLIQQRWQGPFTGGSVWFRWFRGIVLAGGMFGALCATLFASSWMGFFAFAVCLAAWLGYQRDGETGGNLMYLALPVLLIWQPPWDTIVTADTILIQTLQAFSAKLSSQWLDMLGYVHHQPGTVLEFSGRSFGVAEACSGIQSFFAVLCFGALLIVYLRRSLWLGLLLLATCPCWALLMNTIRITAIPVAYALLGIDLSHGFLHDLLGYCTMALALGLLLSTDELLIKLAELLPLPRNWLLGNVHTRGLQPHAAQSTGWVAAPSGRLVFLLAPVTVVYMLSCGIQLYDAIESWGQQKNVIDFFRDEPLVEMSAGDAPDELGGWPQIRYVQETRSRGNDDLGERSDLWHYQAPFGTAIVSFDQMFPGWHELTRCYNNAGWIPEQRIVLDGPAVDDWPLVIVHMSRNNERGYLIFSEVDRSGQTLQPPGEYSYWSILQERLRGRLTPAVRGALFSVVAYQAQVFVSGYAPLDETQQSAVLERFRMIRGKLWNAAQQRL